VLELRKSTSRHRRAAAEIYIDGKFFGNTPSDNHSDDKRTRREDNARWEEWTRTVQITVGEIQLRAEVPWSVKVPLVIVSFSCETTFWPCGRS
jgi:hypothetical protein